MDEDQRVTFSVEAWKKTIDVQQHFNEICMKIRNVYATLLTGLFALIGILETRTEDVLMSVFGYEIHGVMFVLLGIYGMSMLFYFIDRHWYHRLLVGSVLNGIDVEDYLDGKLVGFKLTKLIGDNSALDISKHTPGNWMLFILAKVLFAEVTVRDEKRLLRSDAKLTIFYKSMAYVSLIALAFIACSGGIAAIKEV